MQPQTYRSKSYWLSTRDYIPGTSLSADLDVDVAVVGGGFTGLSTAYHLKKAAPGLRIALLESEVIGFGASGRNGGFNMTLFGLTLSITALRFGRHKAREAHQYMERAVDLVRNLVAELKLHCDYEHPGFLRVATSEKYRARIQEEIELAHKLGLQGIEWLSKDRLAREIRSPMYLGAWWEPRCGILNPAQLAWSWKEVITGLGVAVYERSPVTAISRRPGKIVLKTPGGTLKTDKMVMATNAWSHHFPAMRRKQLPVWTHIVLTEPIGEKALNEIGWQNRQGIEDARNLVHYYRLTSDNRLLMGGRDVTAAPSNQNMDHDLNPATFAGLKDDVRQLFPSLRKIRFTHEWGGPVSVPLDMAPALGFLGDKNVVYSLGCVGHGVSLTHLNGKTIADLLLEKRTDLTEVFFVNRRTIPWPPNPLCRLTVKAILDYMHWEDRRFDAARPGGAKRARD